MLDSIEIFFKMAAVVGGPLLAVLVVPALARRFLKASTGGSVEAAPPPAELEALSHRVAELEERVDFAERLLAQQRESGRLP